MKLSKKIMVGAILMASAFTVNAQSLSDILSGLGGKSNSSSGGVGDILSGVIEGVFTKSNLTLDDLIGEYQAQGPAVTFQSENFLQKAGGIAGAATIESKLKPYYEQYGLNNMTLTVDEDHNFVMKIKSISLKGNITKNDEEGTFNFNFNVLGINLGGFKAYVEKSGSNLNLMFDATKLKSFISAVAKLTGNSMAKALGSILDSYEGACIGWKMVSISQNNSSSSGSSLSNGLGTLKDILTGGSKSN
ncbi:MAG: DUF4923 family protein [Muribaculaceae bacterium]|nr:DUF4923 family protein [Muribaculaceae bacterium]